jgi:hypothetical protein
MTESGQTKEGRSVPDILTSIGIETPQGLARAIHPSLLSPLGRHSPNVSTILLQFFYDFSTIIPRAHFPAFPREILVSRSKKNSSPNLACTKFFYNSSSKSP